MRLLHDDLTGHHHRFLVRQGDILPLVDGGKEGTEPYGTHHRGYHEVHFGNGGCTDESLRPIDHLNVVRIAISPKFLVEGVGAVSVEDGDEAGFEPCDLFAQDG